MEEISFFSDFRRLTSKLRADAKNLRESVQKPPVATTRIAASEAFAPLTNRIDQLESDVTTARSRYVGSDENTVPSATQAVKAVRNILSVQNDLFSALEGVLQEYGYKPQPRRRPAAAPALDTAVAATAVTLDQSVELEKSMCSASSPVVGDDSMTLNKSTVEIQAINSSISGSLASPGSPLPVAPSPIPVEKVEDSDEEHTPCLADFGISAATRSMLAHHAMAGSPVPEDPPAVTPTPLRHRHHRPITPNTAHRTATALAARDESPFSDPPSELSFDRSPDTPDIQSVAVTPATNRRHFLIDSDSTPESPPLPRTLLTAFAPTPRV